VRIGVLGCANIAERYAVPAFQSIENAEVISIASRTLEKAKEWASRFGIKAENSYDALVSNPDVDAVYIPLPVGLHKEWAMKAANNGKHVMCEKSLAESLGSAKTIVEACRSQGVVLYEDFMCDFHPQHAKVLSSVKNGDIGAPFVFRGYFGFPPLDKDSFRYDESLGGSSLGETGSYLVFMARKLFGEEPVATTCKLFYDQEKDIDIKGVAMLEFSGEKIALLVFSFDAVYQNNYSIWGSAGLIRVMRAYSIPPDMKPIIELIKNENFKEIVTNIDAPAANHFELIFEDFCDTVLNKEERADKINSVYSALLSQARVLEAMRISAREDRKVKLSEI